MKKILRSLKNYYYGIGFRSRLLLGFLLLSIIPTIIVGAVCYRVAYDELLEREIRAVGYTLSTLEEKIETVLFENDYRIVSLAVNDVALEMTSQENDMEHVFQVTQLLYGLKEQENIHSAYLVMDGGSVFSNHYEDEEYCTLIEADWSRGHYNQTKIGAIYSDGEEWVIPLTRDIYSCVEGRKIGKAFLNVKERAFYQLLQETQEYNTCEFVVLDSTNNIVSSTIRETIGQSIFACINTNIEFRYSEGYTFFQQEGVEYVVVYTVSKTGLKVISIIQKDSIVESTDLITMIVIVACVIVCCLCFLLAFILSSTMTAPLYMLKNAMDHVNEQGYDHLVNFKYNDEIASVGKSYNAMIQRLNRQTDELLNGERKLRQAEYDALMMQINPHFLYNTLFTINWLTRKDMKKEVYRITEDLTNLFRISVNRGGRLLSVNDELMHIRSYLDIQKVRYDNKFDYIIDVDDEILAIKIPKILLQPLVENAIMHGLENKVSDGIIRITGKRDGDKLVFEVMDNGGELTMEKLEMLNQEIRDPEHATILGVGVRNVHERVQLYCGKEYGLQYIKNGDWTVATITVRVLSEEENYV